MELTWQLVTAIETEKPIRDALYPSPGASASVSKGGGVPKGDHYKALAVMLFGSHPQFEEKNANTWALKIKNRLRAMAKKTNEYTILMGTTGAGMFAEEEVQMAHSAVFTNKWCKLLLRLIIQTTYHSYRYS